MTTEFRLYESEDFNLLDNPGLNDPAMPTVEWGAKLNDSVVKGKPLALVLMVIKCAHRPSSIDRTNILAMQEAIKACKPENVGVIFTFAD